MRDERDELLEIARRVVKSARAEVDVAEVSVASSWDLSAKVRLGQPELVEEAGQRGVSLRVLRAGRLAMTSTSDLSEAGLALLVKDAIELADLSEADSLMGPADPDLICTPPHPELDLYDDEIGSIDAEQALARATKCEAASLAYDARIQLSEGATFSRTSSARAMVLSGGFEGAVRGSYASLSTVPVVEDVGGKKRRGHYWTAKRHQEDLLSEEAVGSEAARRTLAKLGSKKVDTGEMAIIFDPDAARSILGTFAGTIVGGALWRKSSYLLDRIGTLVASELVNVYDDPLIIRGPGSRPFDGEGLRAQKNLIVEKGVLKSYLLDCYSARKLALRSTASASRSGGSVGATTSNFFLQAGELGLDEMVKRTSRGLLVTEMMGFGFNALTGDFSRGAGGFLIEDGKVTHPVSEVTISSNLDTMLKGIDLVGNDLDLKTSTASPSFRVTSMTLSGS